MCGIAGFVSKRYNEEQLRLITDTLSHRGPDANGFYFDAAAGIGLGHRRLSIIDLSAAANQPFYSQCGRYVMIYNGEVYNFQEIKAKYNLTTRTHSDSEVILESFAKNGVKAVEDLNGMFLVVIWDKQEHKLYIFRDRLGIKPFYYYKKGNDFAFASELKSLVKLPVDLSVRRPAIANYLYLGYIPGEQTIYEYCFKLMPGHYAVVSENQFDIVPYWTVEEKLAPQVMRNEAEAKTQLKALLESSVEYCMIADVPLGVFLSGGVDSSLVAAIAQKKSAKPVKTFSIGFTESKYNESKYAKDVAAYIGSEHREFIVSEKEAQEQIVNLLDIYDEPYADSSAIPTLLLSQLTREDVTVALCGDGGDELFMGYGFYNWAKRLSNPLVKMMRYPIAKTLYTLGNNRLKRGSFMFEYPGEARLKSHIFSQEQCYFTIRELDKLMLQPAGIDFDESLAAGARNLSAVEAQSIFDIKNYLSEELLVKVDRASMHHSLEVRVPLLDYRLVEFAINLDEQLKLKGDTAKYLLKQVLYDYIPAEYFNRPKWGFALPLRVWLRNELRFLAEEYLSESATKNAGILHYSVVKQIKEQYLGGKDYLFNKVWLIILLHKWMTTKSR
jgi:asparagine synthase (glutamine-hydrolysing)